MSLLSPSPALQEGSDVPPHRSLTPEAQEGRGATAPADPVALVGVPAGSTSLRPSARPSARSLCRPQGHCRVRRA